MANKFEANGLAEESYQVVENAKKESDLLKGLAYEKKVKTSFSIKASNVEKLEELKDMLGAKSKSTLLDSLIEKSYNELKR